ncbi:MAG: hypothetical protein ACJ71P_04030 [Nitrososphaeraceae archaeon]|jgi:hypothetical protein
MKKSDKLTPLQSKNVIVEAINQHIKLNKELNKNGLSTDYIDKLLNVLLNAKEYGFDGKKNCREAKKDTTSRKERR